MPMQVALAFDQTPAIALFAMHVTFNVPELLFEYPLAHERVAVLFSERVNFDGAFELEVFSFGFALQKSSITTKYRSYSLCTVQCTVQYMYFSKTFYFKN